jgi:hypothetical protein
VDESDRIDVNRTVAADVGTQRAGHVDVVGELDVTRVSGAACAGLDQLARLAGLAHGFDISGRHAGWGPTRGAEAILLLGAFQVRIPVDGQSASRGRDADTNTAAQNSGCTHLPVTSASSCAFEGVLPPPPLPPAPAPSPQPPIASTQPNASTTTLRVDTGEYSRPAWWNR